jgi:hypothetical protein
MISRLAFRLVSAGAVSVLAACGGGGGSAPAGPPHPTATAASYATAVLSITVPAASGPAVAVRGAVRTPRYVSPATGAVQIFVNGATTPSASVVLPAGVAGAGGTTYPVAVSVPVGTDTFVVNLTTAAGTLLSSGSGSAAITYTGPNTVAITANGLVGAVRLAPASFAPPAVAGPVSLGISAFDPAGYALTGTFAVPVQVTVGTAAAVALASSTDAANASTTLVAGSTAPIRYAVRDATGRVLGAAVLRPGAKATGKTAYAITGGTDDALYGIDTQAFTVSLLVGTLPSVPTAIRVAPNGATVAVGLANGTTLAYATPPTTPFLQAAPRATTQAPAVVDLAIDDASTTIFSLVANGDGTFAVETNAIAGGGGSRFSLGSASGCTRIALDVTGTQLAVACASGTYAVVFSGANATGVSSFASPITAVAQSFVAPFAAVATSGTGSLYVLQPSLVGGQVTFALSRQLAVGTGSSALTLDPTGRFAYAGTAASVQVLDTSANPPAPLVGTIPVGSPPTQLVDIPGGYVLPDAQLWAVEANGKAQVLDPHAFVATRTFALPGPIVALDFGP